MPTVKVIFRPITLHFHDWMAQFKNNNHFDYKSPNLLKTWTLKAQNRVLNKPNKCAPSYISQKNRIQNLKNWYEANLKENPKIKILDDIHVNLDSDDGIKEFEKFNNDAVVNGYEGIMIKDPESFYECKRSTNWLKSKPFIEVSLKVKNYEEGSGRNKGKLGAIIAEGNDNGKFFKLNIGSGFTDKQRNEY